MFNVQEGDTLNLSVISTEFLSENDDARDSIMSFTIDSVRKINYGGTN
ncbi:hypothetical protein [Taibaiella sp. KBW10]|nr:hypothetical protein [Taibaiella sp. KBW10]